MADDDELDGARVPRQTIHGGIGLTFFGLGRVRLLYQVNVIKKCLGLVEAGKRTRFLS
jgi:hypothetical protein